MVARKRLLVRAGGADRAEALANASAAGPRRAYASSFARASARIISVMYASSSSSGTFTGIDTRDPTRCGAPRGMSRSGRLHLASAEIRFDDDDAMATAAEGASEYARYESLFPLTFPVPSPATHDGLVPADDLVLEQELLRNPDNFRTWNSYIAHVEETNYRKRPLPDAGMSSEGVQLLGLLSDASQRLALQRIVSVYERALAQFPRSYRLWHRYLDARARFVLGEMRGGAAAARKRMLQTNHVSEMGPTLLDARKAEEEANVYEFGLDGVLGWQEWRSLAAAYERALMWLPTMPRLWLDYLALFVHPKCSPALSRTHARRTFDRALRTLPGSLHLRVWKVYLRWAELCGGIVAQKVWRRYLAVDPSLSERYVTMLVEHAGALHYADGAQNSIARADAPHADEDEDDVDDVAQRRILEAAKILLRLARRALDGTYTSPDGKSAYQLLLEWLDLTERFPEETGLSREEEATLAEDDAAVARAEDDAEDPARLPVRRIVERDGLARFPDQAGRLWTGLATYYIKRGDFDAAHDTFEQGMKQVLTVRDFTQIFDAYAETSENVIRFLMDELAEPDEDDEDDEEGASLAEREAEVDRRMQAFEELMERRPFLVNDVLLRRNPDDVQEWEKRVALWGDNDAEVVATYKQAIDTINPRKATPNLHQLYLHFARFYEQGGAAARTDPAHAVPDLAGARQILEKAVKVPFRRVDDLAEVWCSWAEMEVRHGHYDEALRVLSRATSGPTGQHKIKAVSYYDDALPPQSRLFKSLRVWGLYTDLQESLGSLESAKHAFDRIMELKIANAQTILNYALFLEEQHYFEESFKVYERGVEVFTYPVAFELWNVYLSKFVKRYVRTAHALTQGGSRLERTRDLFEQALDKCPPKFAKMIYMQYGAFEEEHGLLRKAMSIYERATRAVAAGDRYTMYLFYLAKAAAHFGLAATRPIYEAALESLPDREAARIGQRFAAMERKLGEVDRARAIYAHTSQLCNPKTQPAFWDAWNAFEIESGTEDTFREMRTYRRLTQCGSSAVSRRSTTRSSRRSWRRPRRATRRAPRAATRWRCSRHAPRRPTRPRLSRRPPCRARRPTRPTPSRSARAAMRMQIFCRLRRAALVEKQVRGARYALVAQVAREHLVGGDGARTRVVDVHPARVVLAQHRSGVVSAGREAPVVVHHAKQRVLRRRAGHAQRRTHRRGVDREAVAVRDGLAALLHAAHLVVHKALEVQHEHGGQHLDAQLLGRVDERAAPGRPHAANLLGDGQVAQRVLQRAHRRRLDIERQRAVRLEHNARLRAGHMQHAAHLAVEDARDGRRRVARAGGARERRLALLADLEPLVLLGARGALHLARLDVLVGVRDGRRRLWRARRVPVRGAEAALCALLRKQHLFVQRAQHKTKELLGVLLVAEVEEVEALVQAHRIVHVVRQDRVDLHLEQRRVRHERDLGVEAEAVSDAHVHGLQQRGGVRQVLGEHRMQLREKVVQRAAVHEHLQDLRESHHVPHSQSTSCPGSPGRRAP